MPVSFSSMVRHNVDRPNACTLRPLVTLLAQLRHRVAAGEDAGAVLDDLQVRRPDLRRAYLAKLDEDAALHAFIVDGKLDDETEVSADTPQGDAEPPALTRAFGGGFQAGSPGGSAGAEHNARTSSDKRGDKIVGVPS